jgi:phytanoyl-CoA hydroxylase
VFSLFRKKPKPEPPPQPASPPRFHSKFGGLWVDRLDAEEELAARLAQGRIAPELGRKIAQFMRDGYLILEGAVDARLAGQLAALMTKAFREGDPQLKYQADSDELHSFAGNTPPRGKRIIEAHALRADIRDAFASPAIVEFLTAIFDEPAVLSQSLMFQMGSEQRFHRDTTFVRFDSPMRMVGCWIALENVVAGSGELAYIVGSHRIPDFEFSHGKKDGVEVGPEELDRSLRWVEDESDKRGLRRERFLAKKGDALIWHADLAHGGSPITDPERTRQSVVGHLSPLSVGRSMHSSVRRPHGPIHYSSTYYDLNALG